MILDEVALRKESVDRNTFLQVCTVARRLVALRKESVDRNCIGIIQLIEDGRRSPQGERG